MVGDGRRWWVGGATGFLGSHLVRLLVSRGHSVVAVSRSGAPIDGLDSSAVEYRAADVLDADAVAETARGCEGGFLSAGMVSRRPEDAEILHRLHVAGTRSALAGLSGAGVRRVVVASTSGTIAVSADPRRVVDEAAEPPLEIIHRWPYYRSKLYAEREALDANRPPEFEVVVVNPSLLLGPGDLRGSSTGDIRLFLDRAIPAVPAGGVAFVDARDAAAGMLAAYERGRAGERYLLNAKNIEVGALFERLERLTGIAAPKLRLPRSIPVASGAARLFERAVRALGGEPPVDPITVELGQYYWYCDSSKAERELGWRARDPGETLRETVEDLRSRALA
ncbi:MAG TPA: NAD-dependent epimerase/dehydratase family protein [Polyangiaceae bacterium]|nr:NAD-dependent epimerase/dehydratase family protein [Polyangiaceae bacterium]